MDFSSLKFVKIVVFVPVSHADKIRDALAEAGAGQVGNYERCSFSVRGNGTFLPLEGSKPFSGKVGKIEDVVEVRIETICAREKMEKVLKAVRAIHPYEEPAIDVYPLLNT